MGINCLFGHDFEPPETETEREKRGQEAIVTTREVKICRDCGARQILTENTAIVGRENAMAESETDDQNTGADSVQTDAGVDTTADGDTPTGTAVTPTETADANPTATPDRIQTGADSPEPTAEPDTTPLSGDEPDVTDDAVILGEESDDRDPMEWPDFGPASRRDDESADGLKTEPADSEPTDQAAEQSIEFDVESDPPVLYCENCSATWDRLESSLLAGDPCPRCRSAYVTERSP